MGTKPMSIYCHVPSKDEIVDGMVDRAFAEIEPSTDEDRLDALRQRCVSARAVLNRHPWAVPLIESRTSPGPETLGPHEAVVGCLPRGGLSWPMVAHANAMLDAYIYGFALVEASLPSQAEGKFVGVVEEIASTTPTPTQTSPGSPSSTCFGPATSSATCSRSVSTFF